MITSRTYGRIIALCGLLLIVGSLNAQPRLHAPELYVGVHGGVSASTMIFNPSVSNMSDPFTNGMVLGGNGGLVFRYAGHKVCGFQLELNYMHRGWREHNAEGTYERHLHYLEVPFLTHLYFGKKAVRGFINLGPQIGYCVADRNSGNLLGESDDHQYAPITKPFDWGVALGLGMYVRTKNAGVYQLELRGNYSLGSAFGTRATDYFNNANPLDVSVNLAWLMPLNKKLK